MGFQKHKKQNTLDAIRPIGMVLCLTAGLFISQALANTTVSSDDLKKQLWEADISAPVDPNQIEGEKLSDAVSMLAKIKIKDKKPRNTFELAIETQPAEQITEQPLTPVQPVEVEKEQDPNLISQETLLKIRTIISDKEKLANISEPLALAEILYKCKLLPEAAVFYQAALDKCETHKDDSLQDQAWMLFQMANCLKNSEPDRSVQLYKELIIKHPKSQWTLVAKTEVKLAEWLLGEKPFQLLNLTEDSQLEQNKK